MEDGWLGKSKTKEKIQIRDDPAFPGQFLVLMNRPEGDVFYQEQERKEIGSRHLAII
jgi:hypothetical protein